MLGKGFLASNHVCGCKKNTTEIVSEYFSLLDPIICLMKQCKEGWEIKSLPNGPISHSGFKRLNIDYDE